MQCQVGHETGESHPNKACETCWRQHITLRAEKHNDLRCLSCKLAVSKRFLVKRLGFTERAVENMRNRAAYLLLETRRFYAKYQCSADNCVAPTFLDFQRQSQQQRDRDEHRRQNRENSTIYSRSLVCSLELYAALLGLYAAHYFFFEDFVAVLGALLCLCGLLILLLLLYTCVLWYQNALFAPENLGRVNEENGDKRQGRKKIPLRCLSGHQTERVAEPVELAVLSATRPCPKCHVRIERSSGCDHVVCTRCNQAFCYGCNRKKKAYDAECGCTARANLP